MKGIRLLICIIVGALIVLLAGCSKDSDLIINNHNADQSLNKASAVKPLVTLPYNVSINSIQFDYNPANQTTGSIPIRQDWNAAYSLPEYCPSLGRNNPFAYVMGTSKVYVLVYIQTSSPQSLHDSLQIKGVQLSGGEIGSFSGTITLTGADENNAFGNGYLVSDSAVSRTVGINSNLQWTWTVTAYNNNACNYIISTSGPHKLYRLYGVPSAPWYFQGNSSYGLPTWSGPPYSVLQAGSKLGVEPQTTFVLDKACTWASGLQSSTQIVTTITQQVYTYLPTQNITYLRGGNGTPVELGQYGELDFLYYNIFVGLPYFTDCEGSSDIVHILTTALGINTQVIHLYPKTGGSFNTTSCLPFGWSTWGGQAFSFHQVVYYNTQIFDPTARFASNYYNVITGVSQSAYLGLAIAPGDISNVYWSSPNYVQATCWTTP
jgi:hypothetical protein